MRARNIKPGFYKNADLAECSVQARLLAPGLWMLADREGRLADRPKQIRGEIFPYDDADIEALLSELQKCNHIKRYEINGSRYIQINEFYKHQRPHHLEVASEIPSPETGENTEYYPITVPLRKKIYERDGHCCVACGATNSLSIDHIIPVCKGGRNNEGNLQTLCKPCNSSKHSGIDISKKRRGKVDNRMRSTLSHDDKNALCPTDTGYLNPDNMNADGTGGKTPAIGFDGEKFTGILSDRLTAWATAYPALDIQRELSAAAEWLIANPKNRKSNYQRFLVNWFSRAQDKAPRVSKPGTEYGKPTYDFALKMLEKNPEDKGALEIKREYEAANA